MKIYANLILFLLVQSTTLGFENAMEVENTASSAEPGNVLEILSRFHKEVSDLVENPERTLIEESRLKNLTDLKSCLKLKTVLENIESKLPKEAQEDWLVAYTFLNRRCRYGENPEYFIELKKATLQTIQKEIEAKKVPVEVIESDGKRIEFYERMQVKPIYHRLRKRLNSLPDPALADFYLNKAHLNCLEIYQTHQENISSFIEEISYYALVRTSIYLNRILHPELMKEGIQIEGIGICRSQLNSLLNSYPTNHIYRKFEGKMDEKIIPRNLSIEEQGKAAVKNIAHLVNLRSKYTKLEGQIRYFSMHADIPSEFIKRRMEDYLQNPTNEDERLKAMRKLRQFNNLVSRFKNTYKDIKNPKVPLKVHKAQGEKLKEAQAYARVLQDLIDKRDYYTLCKVYNPTMAHIEGKKVTFEKYQDGFSELFKIMAESDAWFLNEYGNLYFSVKDLKKSGIVISSKTDDFIVEVWPRAHPEGKYFWYLHRGTKFNVQVSNSGDGK